MKTVYTTLPIYDSVLKQDYNRTGALIPVYTPRHRLPSFQYVDTGSVAGAVTRIDLADSSGTLTNITTYFPTLSDAYALTSDTYYKYDGDTLNYLLPYGAYYLKITHANGYIYYSEWIVVTDVYSKLVTSFTNISYNTFTNSGTTITNATETDISGRANSNTFTLRPGEVINVIFYFTLTSGSIPAFKLYNFDTSAIIDSGTVVSGLNIITLTATIGGNYYIYFFNNTDTHWSTSEIYCIRSYSPDFIRIDFNDTHDLGDIVYQSGFTQSLWIMRQLNTPQHEPVMIGDEKNGIFIADKIVTKFKFRILTYAGPVLYRALLRLPQHDTITITDEVGFTYSPTVGNIQVNPISWEYFDTGKLEIVFNDNSEFIWTSEANNLT